MAFAGNWVSIDEKLSRISLESDNCFEKAVSTLDMNQCGGIKLREADSLLNQVYQARVSSLKAQAVEEKDGDELSKIGEETLKRLRAAQKAWIVFRDADCLLQGAEMLHGSGEGTIISGCLADKTFKRVKEIIPTSPEDAQ